MAATAGHPESARRLDELLGYLNFSSGAEDPQFLANLNEIYRKAALNEASPLEILEQTLLSRLNQLAETTPAFRDADQARAVIDLTFRRVIPAYREYHSDLLFHQSDGEIWQPFLLGRAMQSLLRLGSPWDELDRLVDGSLDELNDFIGHRPLATLRTSQRMEPYDHEWVAPVPIYVRSAGVSCGRYERLLTNTLEILRATAPELLRAAHFDPELLDELCLDPRAYDFDHPVNKRANYHFGQWDPNHLDGSGRYRRFVVQQMTLDGLLERCDVAPASQRDELLYEAAAVLAGTILMAAGTSGSGPDAHDSTVTLGNLLPRIANYRDEFYKRLVEQNKEGRRKRLQAEAKKNGQPFAGARQHLNHYLARRRASQLEHVHLAILFARMGYPDAARRQAAIIPVASARMICEIRCRLSTANLAVERGELESAANAIDQMEDLLHRAIECGAMVDPWNMLGFQGQFSLFPSPENSVPDHRVSQMIELLGDIFGLQSRLWSEAAAGNNVDLQERIARVFGELAHWWDQFASTTIEDLQSFRAGEAYLSALQVADAMKAWHQGGTAAGDIAFWRVHVQQFTSPRSYGLVVDALLAKQDYVASLALLMQWLSQAESISLEQGEFSFHRLARRWLAELCRHDHRLGADASTDPKLTLDRAKLLSRFFDSMEANADVYWSVPTLSLDESFARQLQEDSKEDDDAQLQASVDDEDDDNEGEDLFAAAYDEMVYRDSTGDGVDADMLESGPAPISDYELDAESRRLAGRLEFLSTVAVLWRSAASAVVSGSEQPWIRDDFVDRWLPEAEENEAKLMELLAAVNNRKIPAPSAGRDSLLEFDRRRSVKLALLEQIVATTVETTNAARLMRAASKLESDDQATQLLQAVLRRDEAAVRSLWPEFLGKLRSQSVLYVSPSKGGDPRKVIEAQRVQHTIRELLRLLPRLGMLSETCQLIQAARRMENDHPVGANAVTEFDRLFEVGYKSLVETLVEVSRQWPVSPNASSEVPDTDLVDSLEQLTESLLHEWLSHSRTLRLTVLERMLDEKVWNSIKEFIERYGHDLFTQQFLNVGNLRAILHGGVDAWFEKLLDDPEQADSFQLLGALDQGIPRVDAVKRLTLVLEAVVENYGEYRDYNNTTTQSDRGELLFTLLDFLRVRAQYERVAWQLKPVLLAHEILVRRGRTEAAEMWRRAVADRTSAVADSLETRLAELPSKYGMRLPSVTDRIGERFVRPLTIDRVRSLVRPAMESMRRAALAGKTIADDESYFSVLEQECAELTQEPSGAGLEVPPWLRALEAEVEATWQVISHPELVAEADPPLAQRPLTADDVTRQFEDWQVVE
jgi:hypothetical protein